MKLIALVFSMLLFVSFAYAQTPEQLQQAYQYCRASFYEDGKYTLPACNDIDKKIGPASRHAAAQAPSIKPDSHAVNPHIANRLKAIADQQRAATKENSKKFIENAVGQ